MTKPFRFGVQVGGTFTPEAFATKAARAEELGYSTFYFPDHFIDTELAPMVAMATAAAVTSTLNVGALVFDNDYKHPAILAKEIATIDVLSGGRAELGIGAGWMEVDYTALGLPYDRPGVRIDRLAEALEVIKGCYGAGAVHLRRHALHGDRLPGHPEAHPGAGPDPHRWRRPAGAAPRRRRGRHRRHQPEPARRRGHLGRGHGLAGRDDRPEGRVGQGRCGESLRRPRAADPVLPRVRHRRPHRPSPRPSRRGSASPPTRRSRPASRSSGRSTRSATSCVARRDRWGVSYAVIGGDEMEMFAPVVERLAGT